MVRDLIRWQCMCLARVGHQDVISCMLCHIRKQRLEQIFWSRSSNRNGYLMISSGGPQACLLPSVQVYN